MSFFEDLILGLVTSAGAAAGGGNGGTSGFEPSDAFRRTQTNLGDPSADENELMQLILSLARSVGGIGGEPLPGGLTLESLASGELPDATQGRIQERAFAGVDEGLRRAGVQSSRTALGRGLGPASSFEATAFGELSRPLLESAAGRQASLEQAELDRLGGLRERTIANMLAIQDLPALNKLLSLRLAEGQRDELSLGRFPGDLPGFVGEDFGLPQDSLARPPQIPFDVRGRGDFRFSPDDSRHSSNQGGVPVPPANNDPFSRLNNRFG